MSNASVLFVAYPHYFKSGQALRKHNEVWNTIGRLWHIRCLIQLLQGCSRVVVERPSSLCDQF